MSKEIRAYKGFDKNMKCRGFQFEFGETYEHEGAVRACSSGFHACENPFDVWSYYGPHSSRFADVTLSGDTDKEPSGDSKIAASKITIGAEIALPDFVGLCVDWVIGETKDKSQSGNNAKIGSSGDYAQIGSSGNYAQIGSSGNYAQIGSSGNSAKIGSSGNSAQIGSSGYYAQIGSSGNYAKIGSSGNSAKIGSSGNYAKIGSSGNYAQIGSSGDGAQITAEGDNAVVACAAPAKVRAGKGGAICIPYYDGERNRFAVGYVGENGIEPGVWYRPDVKTGKLVECDE